MQGKLLATNADPDFLCFSSDSVNDAPHSCADLAHVQRSRWSKWLSFSQIRLFVPWRDRVCRGGTHGGVADPSCSPETRSRRSRTEGLGRTHGYRRRCVRRHGDRPVAYGMTAGVRPSDQASGGGGEIVIHNAARVRDELMALANVFASGPGSTPNVRARLNLPLNLPAQSSELISFSMGRIVAGCNLFSPLRPARGESAVAPRFDEFSEDRGTHPEAARDISSLEARC
jgi:hypothetical protein